MQKSGGNQVKSDQRLKRIREIVNSQKENLVVMPNGSIASEGDAKRDGVQGTKLEKMRQWYSNIQQTITNRYF